MAAAKGRDRSRGGPSSPPLAEREAPSQEERKSTIGRPRVLTDRQVAMLLAEHERFLAWRALRKTVRSQRELARELGVSQGTVSRAVRSSGRYKQPDPENRAAELKRRRRRLAHLRAKGLL